MDASSALILKLQGEKPSTGKADPVVKNLMKVSYSTISTCIYYST